MNYQEATEVMLRGGSVQRGGRMFKLIRRAHDRLTRGMYDVTDPENPVRLVVSEDMGAEDFEATDWEAVEENAPAAAEAPAAETITDAPGADEQPAG